MADCINILADDKHLYEELSKAAKKRIEESFTIQQAAIKFTQVLKRINN